jgi:hypothetical protein
MKTSVKFFPMFLICLIVTLSPLGCTEKAAQKKTTISDAERALAILDVQNIMSKHAYYHANGMQQEEMQAIWVSKDGKYAKDCHFANPSYIMVGYDVTMKNYGTGREDREQKSLDAIVKAYPEIKNIPENRGVGHEWAMHTQTTPIIEIAGDGQTAKGVWYSPGIGLFPKVGNDGSVIVRGTFFWEMYGVDFAKEDGKWKIWHLQTFYDYTPSLPSSMTERLGKGPSTGSAPAGGAKAGAQPKEAAPVVESMEAQSVQTLPEGYIKNPVKYENWSPTRKPQMDNPRLPESYYTFSETFSY